MLELIDRGKGLYIIKIVSREIQTLDIPELKEKLIDAVNENQITKLVLDLSPVSMITSSGIGIFLSLSQLLKSRVRIAGACLEIINILELTKVSSVIKTYDTVDSAVRDF